MKFHRTIPHLLPVPFLAGLTAEAGSQTQSYSGGSSATSTSATYGRADLSYLHPTLGITINNYARDAFGRYAFAEAAFTTGVDQAARTPPEWNLGLKGYSERFGSDFGIALVATTTRYGRYGLGAAFRQDTAYYRDECRGVLPRLRHAAIPTVTGPRGEDGHRVFSIPALVASYAGTTAAVYGWYPSRYGAKDAFRMRNCSLLISFWENIALEFFYGESRSSLSHKHRNYAHFSTTQGLD